MESVARKAAISGHVGVVVDSPESTGGAISQAQADFQGIRPYVCTYDALSIRDWSIDRFGQLNWVRLQETERDDLDPFSKAGKEKRLYRTWTKTHWFLTDESGNPVIGENGEPKQGEHKLGVVPFVMFYFKKHLFKDFVGMSLINDIARVNRLHTNVMSYIDEYIGNQAFSFLALPDPGVGPNEDSQEISQKKAYRYDPESGPPDYVTPSSEPALFMMNFASQVLRREIWRMAKLEHRELDEESGIAKEFDFHQTNNALARFSRNLEIGENRVLFLRSLWNRQPFDGFSDYPDDFNIQTINTELQNAMEIRNIYDDKSPTFVSEHLRRLAERIQPKLEEDVKALIQRELSDAQIAENRRTQFEAEIRRAA